MTIDSPIITGSIQSPLNLTGNISASGAITGSGFFTSGNIVANTLVVQVVSSSVDYITGSAKFGTLASNTFQFTGSLFVTGALYVTTGSVGIGTQNPSTKLHVASYGSSGTGYFSSQGIPSLGFANSSSIALFTNGDPNYGTLFGVQNTGNGWIQQQRVDGTATAYNLLLQPSGGFVGIGTSTPFSQLSLPSGTGWNGGLAWNYTTANSSSKRWWINTDQIVYGDFRICTEITQGGGTISSAGTLYERFYINHSGSVVLGLTSDFNGERLRVGGSTSANKPAMAITSANPNVSCPNGTATTVYTFPSYPRVMYYMVFVRFDTGTDANGYATYAVVAASNAGSKLMTVVNGSASTLTLSGLNVQINQTSGATQNAVVSVIQIFANGGSD